MHNKNAIMTATQVATMTEEEMMAFTKADLSTTAKAWKQNDASCNIAVSNTKPVLVKDMKLYAVKKENDEKKNDAPKLLLESVTQHLRTSGDADGTFVIGADPMTGLGGTRVQAKMYGKDFYTAKRLHIFPSLNEEKTEKTENGKLAAKILDNLGEYALSHAVIEATHVSGANTSSGNQMRSAFANLHSGQIEIKSGANRLLSMLGGSETNSESGLIRGTDVDAFVRDLQSRMPANYLKIGWCAIDAADDDEFASVIIYDVTEKGTSGMFKTERRNFGTPWNPVPDELCNMSYIRHMHGRNGTETDVHAFRTVALMAMNLIPFATRKSSMNEAIMPYLRLATLPDGRLLQSMNWEDLISVIEMCLEANHAQTTVIKGKTIPVGRIFEARRSDFVPGSKSEKAAAATRTKGGRPLNKIDLKPENIKDLKKGAVLLEKFFDIACGQGRTASIMNMLANENRVGTQSDGLANIGWLLRQKGQASRKDSTAMKALEQLQEDSVFWPFRHEHGVQSGGRAKRVTNMDGTYSKSTKHLRPYVTTVAGIGRVIALESLPLDQKSIDTKNAEFEKKKNARRKQNNRNRTGGNGSKKANRQIRK